MVIHSQPVATLTVVCLGVENGLHPCDGDQLPVLVCLPVLDIENDEMDQKRVLLIFLEYSGC